jgi:F-type H+-transporting ATPase subunit b
MDMVIPKLPQLLTTLVGFLLMVWILSKYAWGPILDLLDQRREKIEKDYVDAEQTLESAKGLEAGFEAKLVDIKVLERERVQEAVKRGEELSDNIVAKARSDAQTTREKGLQDLEIESQKAQIQLRDDVVGMAIGAAEKVITTKLDDAEQRRLIQEYIDNLGELPHA